MYYYVRAEFADSTSDSDDGYSGASKTFDTLDQANAWFDEAIDSGYWNYLHLFKMPGNVECRTWDG